MSRTITEEFDELEEEGSGLLRRGIELLQEFQTMESPADRQTLADSTTFLLCRLESEMAELERMLTLNFGPRIG